MKIYSGITELIGHTPLMRAEKLEKAVGAKAEILLKLEYLNPAGSAKDRVALEMLDEALKSGKITEKSVIIEPTSGNTGIGLAAICASRGMRAIIVMPESMSEERRRLIASYGAELVLTDAAEGMSGSVKKAGELCSQIEGAFIPAQFSNPANPEAHYKTTGPEIWQDTDGQVDILVAGVGTGGTISGTGRYLKEKKPSLRVVALEPEDSPLLSKGVAGPHGLQGIGANFIPEALDTGIYDEIITASTEQAYGTAKLLVKTEGILAGVSSGAALYAACEEAKKEENRGKKIVVILPDSGEKYLSTGMFE